MKYRSENENLKAHILSLRGVAIAELVIIAGLWHGWEAARKSAPLHLPPDLRSGAVVTIDNPLPHNVYAFVEGIYQQLNYWKESGERDYGDALFSLAPYMTPRFQDELKGDLDLRGKKGELAGRKRSVQTIPGHSYNEQRVQVHGNGIWTVTLDLHIEEAVGGMTVKNVDVRYPIRVVRYDVSPEANPWGLALDGYDSPGPERLKAGEPL
jgi:integrating conjugative element protein (TIGR03746 family)